MKMSSFSRLGGAPSPRRAGGKARSAAAFTLIEMLVVLAIIGVVAAMSLPLVLPMMRRKSIDQATEQVKSSLIFARSRAIQTQRMVNVTFLARERAIVVSDYDVLRGSTRPPFCAHNTFNYEPYGNTTAGNRVAKADDRFIKLTAAAVPVGSSTIQYLPEGCNFDLGVGATYDPNDGARVALTYIFLPGGSVWTLPPSADTGLRDVEDGWIKTTLTGSNGKPIGPIIIGPQRKGPNDVSTVQVAVYAMTGQVTSEQLQ